MGDFEFATTAQCTPPDSFQTLTCNDGWTVTGCLHGDPCQDGTVTSAAASTSAAATSSAAASSTQTSGKTTSAQIKKTISTPSRTLRSSSNLPASSSQTSSTTTSSQANSATSSTSTKAANPIAAVSSASAVTLHSSSSSHSNTAAVAAGVVGAIVGAIIASILVLLALRWRKRRTEDKIRATQHDNNLRLQGTDANGAGGAFHDKDGNESAPAYRDADHNSLLYPGTNNTGNDRDTTYKRSDQYSAASSSSPIQPGPEMPGSTPDPIGKQPELEVPAFHIPAELSPNTERSSINTPRPTPSPPRVNSSGQGGLRHTADGSVMHPNLDLTGDDAGGGGRGAKKPGDSHVMSWMSYDDDGADPVP